MLGCAVTYTNTKIVSDTNYKPIAFYSIYRGQNISDQQCAVSVAGYAAVVNTCGYYMRLETVGM